MSEIFEDNNQTQQVKTMASYHKSNLGSFGGNLIVDLNGYTHTTAEEWMVAPVDADFRGEDGEYDEDYHREWAEERAEEARKALDEAEDAVTEWRDQ